VNLLGSSIATRLFRINMIVSAFVLALACLSFYIYDQITVRRSLVRNVSAQARLAGTNCISALTFNDSDAARRTLAAFEGSTLIESATLLDQDGKVFADFTRGRGPVPLNFSPLTGKEEEVWFTDDGLVLRQQVKFHGDVLGTIYLRSNLGLLLSRNIEYLVIAGGVLLLSLLAVIPFSIGLRRSIARPVAELAATAQEVTREKNYSLQSVTHSNATELTILIDSFNQMLREIQSRDGELQDAHNRLEQRVEERTRQLADANRELEAFSYSVSHDLRGPLQAINGFAHMLAVEQGDRLNPEGRGYLEQVRLSSARMGQLIDDLLKLSQVGSGALLEERVDLAKMARDIAAELQEREPFRKVRFVIGECPPAEGDSRLLQVVVDNLIRNAWKYTSTKPDAVIEFGWKPLGQGNMYFVRDDGAGFDANYSDRLFKPFQRLHSNAEFPGTGIGLATVQRIVNRHGGRVWAEGQVGNGATFYFTLPSAKSASLRRSV
jgi:signal transduction histidine kinase